MVLCSVDPDETRRGLAKMKMEVNGPGRKRLGQGKKFLAVGLLVGQGHRYTVTTRMTSALRWAAMRAIFMFHNCDGQSHKTVSADHNF